MLIEFVNKNYSSSDKLRDVVTKKVNKLDKFFEEDTKVKVLFKQVKENLYMLELTIPIDHGVLRAEVSSDNMYNNIDIVIPKLEKQIIKFHNKIAAKSKKFRAKSVSDTDKEKVQEKPRSIVKSKSYLLTPMTVDDAIEEIEMVGHDFFVFLNKETGRINVIYRRADDNYGLIETAV